ncbi:MAG: ABC transporter permease [Haloferacaceae archaeon]
MSSRSRIAARTRLNLLPILGALLLWELLSRTAIVHPVFFPPPTTVLGATVEELLDGEMLYHLGVSLRRILLAYVLGATSGIAVGLAMGWSREIRLLVNPYVAILYPIPKITLLPIAFSLFGVTELARVLTMSLAVFLLVAINTMGGVRQIDDVYVDVALDNGAGTLALYREVILPGALPQIVSGLSLGFGVGFVLIVVIEMVGANSGLGYVIWNSWQLFTIPRMYVALLLINVLGIVFVYGIEELGDSLTPWEGA